jgi:hypothetical protein
MAAEATGRTAALLELDPGYCDVIVRRWQEATGGRVVRSDGAVFDALARERGRDGSAEGGERTEAGEREEALA